MIVTQGGNIYGTVGGGRVEARAIDEAKAMLLDDTGPQNIFFDWNLQKDIGMTCGGTVKLFFEKINKGDWQVVIFGAGHVTQSLARLLLTLPCRVTCIDPRKEWLDKLPADVKLTCIQCNDPKDKVAELPDQSFVICMTKGHKSDLPVLEEIFKTGREFPYLGAIGSKSKAATLRRELREAGIDDQTAQKFHCPLGLALGTNHPGEIAVSIAAQLLQIRDALNVPISADQP